MREMLKIAAILTLICAVTASALEIVKVQLSPRIEMQNDLYVRGPALSNLFRNSTGNQLKNKVVIKYKNFQLPVFYTLDNGKVEHLALEASGKGGYGGNVLIMLGIDVAAERITGMEIIQHAETPGVGSQIEKYSFRKQWINLSALEPVKLKSEEGQIDGISGATYSSAAAFNGTNLIIDFYSNNKENILEMILTHIANNKEL
jgi:electron transport complex protein RnfG